MVETLAPNLRSHYGAERAAWRTGLPGSNWAGTTADAIRRRQRTQCGDARARGDAARGDNGGEETSDGDSAVVQCSGVAAVPARGLVECVADIDRS